jgi:prevent-host-death family protein
VALIGVRELREHTAEVLRRVRDEKAEYIITHRGRPVALLLPINADAVEEAMVQAGKAGVANGWQTYANLAKELRASWPEEQSSQDVLQESPPAIDK